MGGSIQVPNNIEDKTILKRFLTDLVLGINSNTLFSGNVQQQNAALVDILQNNPTLDFLNLVSKLTELRTDILTYVEDNLETVILQNTEDVAVIAEQFGTFYKQALAASWYGLSVKAGGAVAGLEIGSLDPDVTTPNDEKSYFRVIADNFIVGRAYEDLTQEEKDYLSANGLPAFGTVYNASKQPVPALITTWSSSEHVYKHYFNGIVQFSNIQNANYAGAINNGTTTINGGKVEANTLSANRLTPSTNGSTVWSGGALVSQNFNGNSVGNIGSPTQGFRLSSNASGTSDDPNIYGAYIKGGTIDGITLTGISLNVSDVRIKADGYPNNFGDIFIKKLYTSTSSITSDRFIARNYLSGYNTLRVCSSPAIFNILVQAHGWSTRRDPTGTTIVTKTYCYLDVSLDQGATFTNLTSNNADFGYASIFYTYSYTGTSTVEFRMRVSNTNTTQPPVGAMEISLINN